MIVGAIITGAGVAIGGFVVKRASNRIKWTSPDMEYLKKELAKLQDSEEKRRHEIRALFKLQEPQLMALIAILEAFKTGKANGSVDAALKKVKESNQEFHDFLMGGVG